MKRPIGRYSALQCVTTGRDRWLVRAGLLVIVCVMSGIFFGCNMRGSETKAVEAVIKRYNELLVDGYKRQNMTWMREVATDEQALKLYHHMAAIGEGKLRMDSTLKDLRFVRIDFPRPDEAVVETKEVWDFTHYRIATGEKFAEEKDFIYQMGYTLNKQKGKWMIINVNTISGTSTNTVIPWPELDRKGNIRQPGAGASTGHPQDPGRP